MKNKHLANGRKSKRYSPKLWKGDKHTTDNILSSMLTVGLDKENDDLLQINEEIRSRHLHVIGGIGTGKTRFLLSMIMQDIINGHGVCVMDPHSQIYKYLTNWLVENPDIIYNRPVRFVDINNTKACLGINPLAYSDPEEKDKVARATATTLASFIPGDDVDKMPVLGRTLYLACALLCEHNLTLYEGKYIFYKQNRKVLDRLVHIIEDEHLREAWENEMLLSEKQFNDDWQYANNRFQKLTQIPILRGMFSQKENCFDFKKAMDDGEIVLLNLQPKTASKTAELIVGRLFIDMAYRAAEERENLVTPRPWFLYMDECHKILTDNIAEIISGGRKMGLHLTLAHQYMKQLYDAGELVEGAVQGTAATKVIFGAVGTQSAEIMAKEVFHTEVIPGKIDHRFDTAVPTGKYEIIRLKNKSKSSGSSYDFGFSDTDTTAHVNTENYSQTKTDNEASISNFAEGEHHTNSSGGGSGDMINLIDDGTGFFTPNISEQRIARTENTFDNEGSGTSLMTGGGDVRASAFAEQNGNSQSEQNSNSHQKNESFGNQQSESEGYSESPQMQYEIKPTKEVALDNQRHGYINEILSLKKATAIISLPEALKPTTVKTLHVPDQAVYPSMTASVIDEKNKKSPYQLSLTLVEEETEKRSRKLMNKLGLDEEEVETGYS